jgi:Kef-type K+ transport system membrane component KefB
MGMAAVKAIAAITAIIAGGRLLLRPIYKQIAENRNAEIFSANTLLVIFGTSLLTARAGLSMALGAFLAGLLLAETEFSLQVESDIAPYRGLLLGLFFMTVRTLNIIIIFFVYVNELIGVCFNVYMDNITMYISNATLQTSNYVDIILLVH